MGYGFTKRFSLSALCLFRRIHARASVYSASPEFHIFLREYGLKTSILDIILRAPRLRQSLFSVCFA